MSGGVVTVAVALVERWTRQNVPTWIYVSILLGFVLCACYLAWRDVKRKENESASQLKGLTRYKLKFKINEVSSRIFVKVPSIDLPVIEAKIKLQFENEDIHPWTMKGLRLTLHKLEPPEPQEIYTFVLEDEYMHSSNKQPIPRDEFEGMLIQGGRVTPWYTCRISLVTVASEKTVTKPEDLTDAHFLQLSMDASNQEPFIANMFVKWSDAATSSGAPVLSYGAPVIRIHENRRLGTLG
jgi:hypothetical protein